MLVVLIVVKVAAVLLDLVHSELGGIDLLGTQAVVVELASDLSVRLAVLILDPDLLDVGALDYMVPLVLADGLLGLGVHGLLLEVVHKLRGDHGEVLPDGLGLGGDLAVHILEGLDPRLEVKVEAKAKVLGLTAKVDGGLGRVVVAEDLLVLQPNRRRGSAQDEGGGRQTHDGVEADCPDARDGGIGNAEPDTAAMLMMRDKMG